MSEIVIKSESVSKQYRLGQVGTSTMLHDLNRWWHNIRGKENPYLKIGEINDRTSKSENEYVWAVNDVSFEVKQGEVLGIIGRNGAGKSTLLKILSRTTAPTLGRVKVKGRVASLLEVGTGFHPELSGRDNVFLNGAILGMTRKEIARKFDEIVSFAGVERYIDTPVKRYSSGMYVRLAFAVAAYLEPEILIVDEVLAVGDVEFQKKCLGKMKDVSVNDGRTVIFVSHNMSAVSSLCTSLVLMRNGQVTYQGGVAEGIDQYMDFADHSRGFANLRNKVSTLWTQHKHFSRLMSIETLDQHNEQQSLFKTGDPLKVNIEVEITEMRDNIEMGVFVNGERETLLGLYSSASEGFKGFKPGVQKIQLEIPAVMLMPGKYTLGVWVIHNIAVDDACEHAIDIEVISENNFTGNFVDYERFKGYGSILRSSWKTIE